MQEDFVEGSGSLLEEFDDYIKNYLAVIHLIGSGTGSNPIPLEVSGSLKKHPDFAQRLSFLNGCLEELSYTRWEVGLAIYRKV